MATVMKKRHRVFVDCHGNWTDPLIDYNVSTTYYPNNDSQEFDLESDMITEIKKQKYKFKASDLSENTKAKFREENIIFEDDQGEDE